MVFKTGIFKTGIFKTGIFKAGVFKARRAQQIAFVMMPIMSFVMSFMMIGAIAFKPQSALARFDGLYIKAHIGALMAHPTRETITITLINSETNQAQAQAVTLKSRLGLSAGAALGLWLDFFQTSRFRMEWSLDYRNYELKGLPSNPSLPLNPSLTSDAQGQGALTSLAIFWNNYLNLASHWQKHQPYLGFGFGVARNQHSYYYLFARDDSQEWDFGLNGSLGYDYRLTDQLGVGVHYRYSHFFASPALNQSEINITISYGF